MKPIDRLLDVVPVQHRAQLTDVLHCTLASSELEGLAGVLPHVKKILPLGRDLIQADLAKYSIDGWLDAINAVEINSKLALRVFPDGEPDAEKLRKLFLQTVRPNPLLRRAMTKHSLHSCLWTSHPDYPTAHSFLQAHAMLAHIAIVRMHVPLNEWLAGRAPNDQFLERLYEVGRQIRNFSEVHGPLETIIRKTVFELFPLGSNSENSVLRRSVAEFPGELRQIAAAIAKIEDKEKAGLIEEFNRLEPRRIVLWRNGKSVKRQQPGERDHRKVSRGLRAIACFLEWGLIPAELPSTIVLTGGGHGGWGGGGLAVGGQGDEHPELQNEIAYGETENAPAASDSSDDFESDPDETSYEDETEPNAKPTVVGLERRSGLDEEEREAAQAAGDHPEDSGTERDIQFAETEEDVRLIFSGAPEMACQDLSFGYGDLSPIEVARWIHAAESAKNLEESERRALLAFASVCIWPLADSKTAYSLQVFEREIPPDVHSFAVCIADTHAFWQIPALIPEIDLRPTPGTARPVVQSFDLPDVVGGTQAVREYLNFLRHTVKLRSAQPEAMEVEPLRLFRRDEGWYRKALESISVPGRKLTFTKLCRMVRREVIDQTGDKILTALINSKRDTHTKVGLHYATPPVELLQKTYIAASQSLRDGLARGGMIMTPLEPCDLASDYLYVGSPLCPLISKLQSMLLSLEGRVGESGMGRAAFIRGHNAWAGYLSMAACICAAMRGVKSPVQKLQAVDIESGLTWIADKGKYKGRLACYPEMMLELLETNQRYLRELASALNRPVSELPCFFLDQDLQEEEISPKTIMRELGEWIPVANAGRHLVYSYFMEHDGSAEVRDCLFGHYSRGEAPFRLSSFQYQLYSDDVRALLTTLLNEIGFKALEAPSICQLLP